MEIISRKRAKELGYKYYYTGKPCKHGHIDFRYTSIGKCLSCVKEQRSRWKNENREHLKRLHREWAKRNPEKRRQKYQKWVENNRKKVRELKKPHSKNWKYKNRNALAEHAAKRRAIKANAMPSWLSEEDKNKIKQMYKNCPKGYHVDHIIPLQGKGVCGLHVPWNLQYLPERENLVKNSNYKS